MGRVIRILNHNIIYFVDSQSIWLLRKEQGEIGKEMGAGSKFINGITLFVYVSNICSLRLHNMSDTRNRELSKTAFLSSRSTRARVV